MRPKLAFGAVALVLLGLVAGLAIRNTPLEQSQLMPEGYPGGFDPTPIAIGEQTVQRQSRRAQGVFAPEDEERQQYEYWRTPRHGDFFTQGEFYRRFLTDPGFVDR
jgi:hypothetical protein